MPLSLAEFGSDLSGFPGRGWIEGLGENPLLGGIFPVKEKKDELGLEVREVWEIDAFIFWLENRIVMPTTDMLD